MNIHKFIDTIKEPYNQWLQSTFPVQYPKVCDTSSDILSSYLINNFPNNNIGFVCGNFNEKFHCWVEVDKEILDFTIVQFIKDYDISKPFVDKQYYSMYKKQKEYESGFIGLEYRTNNFEDYLKRIT